MSSKHLEFLFEELQQLKDQGLYMPIHLLEGMQLPRCVIDGKEVINIASNNYLGLATHPKLKKAAIEAINKYGKAPLCWASGAKHPQVR